MINNNEYLLSNHAFFHESFQKVDYKSEMKNEKY